MWHDVPNRGGRITLAAASAAGGDIGLTSGWQGDNSGDDGARRRITTTWWCPIAKNPDGSPVTGLGDGAHPQRERRQLATDDRALEPGAVRARRPSIRRRPRSPRSSHETIDGFDGRDGQVPRADWALARCSATNPFPGHARPDADLPEERLRPGALYQVVFKAKDPPVLGIGFAAFRDLRPSSSTRQADSDAQSARGKVQWVLGRGISQSGNFLRAFLHLGFNQDEAGRQVQDGAWPMIAGRRVAAQHALRHARRRVEALRARGAKDRNGGVTRPDQVRGMKPGGILDRCNESETCPKIIEHFGAAEIWGLKLGPEWVGTEPSRTSRCPTTCAATTSPARRTAAATADSTPIPARAAQLPEHRLRRGHLPANPMPHTETTNAIAHTSAAGSWTGRRRRPSHWPRLKGPSGERTLVDATKEAMGFPTIPRECPPTAPTGLINPVLDYDFGPRFDNFDGSGVRQRAADVKQAIR